MIRITSITAAGLLAAISGHALAATPATLLLDEFNGTAGTPVSNQLWVMPADDDGSFFGRTKLKVDPADTPTQDGSGFAVLQLDTHFADDPLAGLFHAPEIRTKERFGGGGGISYKWTGAYDLASSTIDPTDGGVVLGGFTFGLQAFDSGNNVTRDEIDWELLLNEQRNVGAGNNRVFTNAYDNANFVGDTGADAFLAPGTDMTVQHEYEIRQLRDRIEWYQDGVLVRTETGAVPRDPSEFRLNLNVPDAGFSEAFDANLTSATTAGANQQVFANIDRVEIKELGAAFDSGVSTTRRTELALANHSFAETNSPDTNFVGGWQPFGNALPSETPSAGGALIDFSLDGDDAAAKIFGSFGGGDSVLIQRVGEAAGQTFDNNVLEAKINVFTEEIDTIEGTNNVLLTVVQFFDSSFNLITDPNDPGSGAQNAVTVFNLDGRLDIEDNQWITANVRAKAPVGTEYVEIVSVFVQTLCNAEGGFVCEGGSVWIDDIELNLLTDILDTNLDGIVGATDIDHITANVGGDPNSAANVDLSAAIDADDVADWLLEYGTASGDANLDRQVGLADFNTVLNNLGTGAGWAQGDFDGSGTTGLSDFNTVLNNLGLTGPALAGASVSAGSVPEPATAALLGLGGLVLLRRRSRA